MLLRCHFGMPHQGVTAHLERHLGGPHGVHEAMKTGGTFDAEGCRRLIWEENSTSTGCFEVLRGLAHGGPVTTGYV